MLGASMRSVPPYRGARRLNRGPQTAVSQPTPERRVRPSIDSRREVIYHTMTSIPVICHRSTKKRLRFDAHFHHAAAQTRGDNDHDRHRDRASHCTLDQSLQYCRRSRSPNYPCPRHIASSAGGLQRLVAGELPKRAGEYAKQFKATTPITPLWHSMNAVTQTFRIAVIRLNK